MKKILTSLSFLKDSFLQDKIGFSLEFISYLFIFLSIATLPIFSYRDSYTFITNSLCVISSLFIFLYIFFRGRFYINYSVICLVLFVVYGSVLTLFTTKQLGFERLTSILTLYSYVFCLIEFYFNKKNNKFFFTSIIASFFILIAYFAIEYKSEIINMSFEERLGSDISNVNTLCFIFALGVVITLFVAFSRKGWNYLLIIPAIIMAFFALLTGSRWGFVSLLLAVVCFLYLFVGKKYKLEFFFFSFVVVASSILIFQLPMFSEYKKHFFDLFSFLTNSSSKRGSSAVRTAMFIDGIQLWLKNIVFGYGCEGFKANTSYGMYSHSTVVELLTNFGMIGFILFYIPLFRVFAGARLKKNEMSVLVKTISFFFISYSLFAVFHISKVGMICWSFFVGIDFHSNKEKQNYVSISFYENKTFSYKYDFIRPLKKQKNDVELNKKLKIAFVISSLYGGGAERVASILGNNWYENGHQVTFLLTSKENGNRYYVNPGINVTNVCPKHKIPLIVAPFIKIHNLTNALTKMEPDVVISFLDTPIFYSSISAKALDLPFICSERSNPKRKLNILSKFMRHHSFSRADHIVFQGEEAMNCFSDRIKDKSTIIWNPCVVERSSSIKKAKRILAAGRLEDLKGFDVLINSFPIVSKEHPDYSLVIYGEGTRKNHLESLIKDLKMKSKISIHPFTNKLNLEMQKSMLYVLSSRYEGMPNTLCEALVLGLPCVATDCPIGLSKELIEDRKNGIVCETENVGSLAESISNVLSNYKSFSHEAELRADSYKKAFDPSLISNKWLEIVNNTISKKEEGYGE